MSPAEEVKKDAMNMAINWACYIAYVQSENEEYQNAQDRKQDEAFAFGKLLEEIEQASTSRG